jgi:hypothetical protein
MTWQDITVFQFQQLAQLWAAAGSEDSTDTVIKTAGICFNLTEQQIDSMTLTEYKKLTAQLDFMKTPMQWAPAKTVTVEGRRYRFVYDVRQIHAARYMEVKQFGAEGLIPALHRVAASMVVPQRRNWLGRWVDDTYDAAKHEQYAEDMKAAPITSIHGSAVFFCKLYAHSMQAIKGFLSSKMTATEKTALDQSIADLCNTLAGNTSAPSSPGTSASLLSRRISSRLSNS